MGLLMLIWLVGAIVLIILAVKDDLFNLPLTGSKVAIRIFLTFHILLWPVIIIYYLIAVTMETNEKIRKGSK